MAKGKVRSLSGDGGGVIAEKGKRFPFSADDVVGDFTPQRDAEVRFDKQDGRARRVRPLDHPEPAPAARHRADDAFVNPYNFVPLHGVPVRSPAGDGRLVVGGHTGRLSVELELRTPASVSPVEVHGPDEAGERVRHPHERTVRKWRIRCDGAGHAVLPGSSLKGALRVVFEALSGSCLSVFDPDTRCSWRPIAPMRPGFLSYRGGGWVVDPAEDVRLADVGPGDRSGDRWTGRAEQRRAGLYATPRGGATYTGELYVTDWPESSAKRHQRVFLATSSPGIGTDEEIVRQSDDAHEHQITQDRAKIKGAFVPVTVAGGGVKGQRRRREPLMDLKRTAGRSRPVWYRKDSHGDVVALGPVALSRVLFRTARGDVVSLGDVLDREEGGYRPCAGRTDGLLCPACAVFGTTWKERPSSGWRGRVTFGPARSAAPVDRSDPVLLTPVGAPHPSAQTFYLWDPAAPGDPKAAAYFNPDSRIRDRKLYWHKRGTTPEQIAGPPAQVNPILEDKDRAREQLRRLELIPAGTRFTLEVGFDGLDARELGLLLLTLEPHRLASAVGSELDLAHKIGGGKPLGMGSATLRVISATLLDPAQRYASLVEPGTRTLEGDDLAGWVHGLCETTVGEAGLTSDRPDVAALLALLDWNAVEPSLLRYPPGNDDGPYESYRWFMAFAAKDRRTGAPATSGDGYAPDPLRTAEEVSSGVYQLTWTAPKQEPPSGGRRPDGHGARRGVPRR